jgi:hypothetical protein
MGHVRGNVGLVAFHTSVRSSGSERRVERKSCGTADLWSMTNRYVNATSLDVSGVLSLQVSPSRGGVQVR